MNFNAQYAVCCDNWVTQPDPVPVPYDPRARARAHTHTHTHNAPAAEQAGAEPLLGTVRPLSIKVMLTRAHTRTHAHTQEEEEDEEEEEEEAGHTKRLTRTKLLR